MRITALALSALLISACADTETHRTDKQQANPPTGEVKKLAFNKAYNGFDAETYKEAVKTLSSDAFEGREPATEGGRKTVAWISEQFRDLGLKPGNGDSYLQKVPLVAIDSKPGPLKIADLDFEYPKNYVATSSRPEAQISLDNSELVFVGYGVNAPEYNWNDYDGIDMKGKTAVILINDPGYATGDDSMFTGKAMTYYGRWTYKYEEAARQGAAGAIIIHDTAPASYGWQVIESSWTGPQYQLPASEITDQAVDVAMWISMDRAQAMFDKAGLDLDEWQQKALAKDFQAQPLNLKASITVNNEVRESESHNVLATVPGTSRADEHVIYMAHWDHIGRNRSLEGDQIYNGAVDNASGTVGIIEIARAFSRLPASKRSVTFIAVTAEEQGLLGSKYFAAHPTVPLRNVVGVFNIDSMNAGAETSDLTVVGYGKSELEDLVAQAAQRQNREVHAESSPERGGFYRSDHFSLAKKGVPAIFAGGGSELKNPADQAAQDKLREHLGKCYHQVCDEFDDNWTWAGALSDLKVMFEAGYLLAKSDDFPNWREGTEFKAIRDADRGN